MSTRAGRRPGPTVRTRVVEHLLESGADTGSDAGPGGGTAGGTRERRHEDRLATEEPLEVRLEWPGSAAHRVWVTMRTPGHDFELAAGWARHEGLVASLEDLSTVAYCTDETLAAEQEMNVVTLTLRAAPARPPAPRSTAVSAGSSACGVCGADSLAEALAVAAGVPWAGAVPSPAVVRTLPDALRSHQAVFDRTGGVHAAALATADGELLVVREDIGRHNAVDKVTGARLLSGADVAGACLVVSGRAGFELVQKAVSAGIGSLVSVGAPTSLSVDLARRSGLVLFGFTGARRTVQYT